MRKVLRFPFSLLSLFASGWLLLGLTVIDQRYRFPYDDGGIGTFYFAGQAIANFVLWPGFAVVDRIVADGSPQVRWAGATVVSIVIALVVDLSIQAIRRRASVQARGTSVVS